MSSPPVDQFQVALRKELANLRCPLPAPLAGAIIFPRAVRGRATLVRWRQGSCAAEWAAAVRRRHGWCVEIPPSIFLLDLDKEGTLQVLMRRLPEGYGLVQSSLGHFHVWLCGEAQSGNHLGHIERSTLEIHGPGRLATLPPTLHVDTGLAYRWLRPFLGTVPTSPQNLGIVMEKEAGKSPPRRDFVIPATGIPLHELMSQLTGQDGHLQGQEWAFFCPRHDDHHASLMVNDEKGLFYCHGAGCAFKGNRITLEKLLGLRLAHRRVIAEVKL
jgi:hypothetical protein